MGYLWASRADQTAPPRYKETKFIVFLRLMFIQFREKNHHRKIFKENFG